MSQQAMKDLKAAVREWAVSVSRGDAKFIDEITSKVAATAAYVRIASVEVDEPKVYGPGYNGYTPTLTVDGGFKLNMEVWLTDGVKRVQLKRPDALVPLGPEGAVHPVPAVPGALLGESGLYSLNQECSAALLEAFQTLSDGRLATLQGDLERVWEEQLKRAAPLLEKYRGRYAREKERAQTPEAQAKKRAQRIRKRDEVFSRFFAQPGPASAFASLTPQEMWTVYQLVRDHPFHVGELGKTIRMNKVAAEGVQGPEDLEEVLKLATVKNVLES